MTKAREISKLSISQTTANVFIGVPAGNTGTRPAPAFDGAIRYNTTLAAYEGYSNGQWSAIGGGGSYTFTSSNTTLSKSTNYLIDTSSGAVYVDLPLSPSQGDWVVVGDGGGDKIISPAVIQRNGSTINSSNTDITIDVPNTKAQFIYTGTTWKVFVG